MYFRLALALGRTVRELEQSLTHDEFVEWCAFYQIEPWGCDAEDERWRQLYNLEWVANFKGDAPHFLDRNPAPAMDPFQVYLETMINEPDEEAIDE